MKNNSRIMTLFFAVYFLIGGVLWVTTIYQRGKLILPEEKKAISLILPTVSEAVLCLFNEGLTAAMNKYN